MYVIKNRYFHNLIWYQSHLKAYMSLIPPLKWLNLKPLPSPKICLVLPQIQTVPSLSIPLIITLLLFPSTPSLKSPSNLPPQTILHTFPISCCSCRIRPYGVH